MNWLRRFAGVVDRCTAKLASAVSWLALVMVVVTLLVVVLRYGFDVGAIALQESTIYMHGLIFLLGIPFGVQADSHVRVDILQARMSAGTRRWVELAGHVFFLLPVAGFILYSSLPYVGASWRVLEGSPEVGGIPAVFLLKTLLPIMAAILLLQGLAQIIHLVLHHDMDAHPDGTGQIL